MSLSLWAPKGHSKERIEFNKRRFTPLKHARYQNATYQREFIVPGNVGQKLGPVYFTGQCLH
jgi:hypothetical protein